MDDSSMTRMQTIEGDGSGATMRLRKAACFMAAREKQMARLQDEFRKLLIQSAEITVDGHDLPSIVETIDEPVKEMRFGERAHTVWYKWVTLAAVAAVLALIFVPFPLFVSGSGKVLPPHSAANAPSPGAPSVILLAVDESQEIGVKPGMPVSVRFGALLGRTFKGTVEGIGGLPTELADGSRIVQSSDVVQTAPVNAGLSYVRIRLDERPPENVYGTEANTQIYYGRFQIGQWIVRTLAG
jgi:hypothetical protein